MAIDMTRACTRSLARSPFLDLVFRSYLLPQRDSVPRIFQERSAFSVFLFFSTAQDGFYGPGVFVPPA